MNGHSRHEIKDGDISQTNEGGQHNHFTVYIEDREPDWFNNYNQL